MATRGKIRVAAIQLRSGVEPAANRAVAEPLLREAAMEGARIIYTPECTTRLDRKRERLLPALRPESDDPEIGAWGKLAAELGVWLSLGSTLVSAPDGRAFNRSILYASNGKIAARYDKIHLFDAALGAGENYRESATFAPGGEAVSAEGPAGAKLGLTVCYDMRFPELYRALALQGADIISVPSAFTRPTGQAHWEILLRARAIETGAFIVAAAQGGTHEDGRATWGHSIIVGPWGEVVKKFDHDEPGALIADLDLDEVESARAKIPAWNALQSFAGKAGA
ncbi:MAG: carbon-nitrogen hydrolase family protein [Hyphomonadaceae bacterium]